ncbi:AAA family ATPase [Candidatus Parcubacteria bacterium]|nr:AAA family ATPase [Candidatus Parcubacteria bacterium]
MTQQEALDILKTGRNVFLTGEPGSGKTHTVNEYVAYLGSMGIEPAITASTGIAATHISGLTIHSWAGIGIKSSLDKSDLKKIGQTKYIVKRVKHAKVLIIDEVSMLSPQTLSMVDMVCRQIKDESAPFGGMQVVLVGDFFQLPPVVKQEAEPEVIDSQISLLGEKPMGRFAYDAEVWKRAQVAVCYLTEQHRQDDGEFLNMLSAIRTNTFDKKHLAYLASRNVAEHEVPVDAPKLFTHNTNVDRVNDQVLATLPDEARNFEMIAHGHEVLVSILKKGCLSPENLCLKTGAAVMFTKNNPKEGFVNGTLGTVEGFDRDTNSPIVKTRGGRKIIVEAMEWALEEGGKSIAKIIQFPLRLAWAITVHKSQGMSLDEAAMDLGRVFEYGQGYVALSRVRRLSGLYLLGMNSKAFLVHPDVLEQDVKFRQESEKAVKELTALRENIEKAQIDFVKACGGAPPMMMPTGIDVRDLFDTAPPEGKEKAYSSWDADQDDQLQTLFIRGASMDTLANTFKRTRGAIRSRLTKLGFLDKKKKAW